MNHYPHHIGDFDRATRHLTRIERSVYRDLLDLYYDTEAPLTLDRAKLCRRIIARSNDETTAVEQVLNEFFTETPTGWYQDRCEQEIEAYKSNTSQKAMAGKASAEAKRLKKLQAINGNSTDVEHPLNVCLTNDATDGNGTPTNQEPITNNQEPIREDTFSEHVVGAADAAPAQPPVDAEPQPKPAKRKAADEPKAERLPADWRLPKAWGDWALGEFPHWTPEAVRIEADKFSDHWATKTGKDARKADWQATWRNWCRSDIAQRSHQPMRAVRPAQLTAEQRSAWEKSENERAKAILFGANAFPTAFGAEVLEVQHETE